MELEDKVKKLKDEFQGLPRPLFRAILCNNKVNGDLTAAVRCLQQFEPKKNTRMRNLPATAADKELKKGLSCTPLDGLSQKENNWTGEGKRKRSKPQPSTLSERSMKTPPPSQSSKPAPPPKPQSARLHSQSSIPRPSVATKLRSTQSPPQTSKPPPPPVAPKPRSTQPPSQTRTGKPPPAVARKPRSTQSPSHTRTSEPPPPPVALKPRSTQPPSQTRTGKPPPPPVAPKPRSTQLPSQTRTGTPQPPAVARKPRSTQPPSQTRTSKPPPPPVAPKPRSTQPPSQTRTGTPQPPAVARKPRSTQSPSQTRTGKPPPPPVAPKPRSTQPPSQTRTGTPQPPAVAPKLRSTPSFSKSSKPALPQKTESTQTPSQSNKLIPPPVALKPQSIRSLSQSSRKASPPKLQSAPPPSQSSKQEHPQELTHLLSPSSRQASPPNPKSSGFAKQGIDFKPEAGNILPENWTPMSHDNEGNGISFHLVKLDSSSPEYQKVMDRILETLHSVDIVSIERVQNYYLYQAYQLLKQKMESDKGESNERQLFHGTTPDNTKKINYSGFDWRFSGFAHGAMYGAGVNFARDASYSIHYATRPSTGPHRVMYLARVLVGRYCLGKKGIIKPPPVNPEFPEIVFDSTVDNLANPLITVVYQDSQCYPEYLITFRKTG